jgi:hypothetical protein
MNISRRDTPFLVMLAALLVLVHGNQEARMAAGGVALAWLAWERQKSRREGE